MQQVSDQETKILLELAQKSLLIDGDLVELGCYRGDTSLLFEKMLEHSHSDKKLWIYDSFAGLPDKTVEDQSVAGDAFKKGELFVSKREVVERFKKANLKVPVVKKGFFEDLNPENDLPKQIAFAFLDGDLYQSIKTSLKLVTPKMARGGVIVVHDYNNPQLPGVTQAVDEWINGRKLVNRETLGIITV